MKHAIKLGVLALCADATQAPHFLASLELLLDTVEDWKLFVCATQLASPSFIKFGLRHPSRLVMVPERAASVPGRYAKLGTLRNGILDVMDKDDLQPDIVLRVDADIWGFWNTEGFAKLVESSDWDAIAVNGLVSENYPFYQEHTTPVIIEGRKFCYYDWLAFESKQGVRFLWSTVIPESKEWFSHGIVPKSTLFTTDYSLAFTVPYTPFGYPVNSAFGPACFYRSSSVEGMRYDENTGQVCHQTFHAEMRKRGKDRIFLSREIIALYDNP